MAKVTATLLVAFERSDTLTEQLLSKFLPDVLTALLQLDRLARRRREGGKAPNGDATAKGKGDGAKGQGTGTGKAADEASMVVTPAPPLASGPGSRQGTAPASTTTPTTPSASGSQAGAGAAAPVIPTPSTTSTTTAAGTEVTPPAALSTEAAAAQRAAALLKRGTAVAELQRLAQSLPTPVVSKAFIGVLFGSAKAPKWFSERAGLWLSRCLMRHGGVVAVVDAMIGTLEKGDPRALTQIATLLATVPRELASPQEYFAAVGPQITDMLHAGGTLQGRLVSQVAARAVGVIAEGAGAAGTPYVVDTVLSPLRRYMSSEVTPSAGTVLGAPVVVDERRLVQCVEDLHKVLTIATPPPSLLYAVAPVVPALFDLYCFARSSVSFVATAIQEVLTEYLRRAPTAASALLAVALPPLRGQPRQRAEFAAGDAGGIVALLRTDGDDDDDRDGDGYAGGRARGSKRDKAAVPVTVALGLDPAVTGAGTATPVGAPASAAEAKGMAIAKAVVALLEPMKTGSLPGDVLVALLEEYALLRFQPVSGSADGTLSGGADDGDSAGSGFLIRPSKRSAKSKSAEAAAQADEAAARRRYVSRRTLRVLQLLITVTEELGPAALRNVRQLVFGLRSVLGTIVRGLGLRLPDAAGGAAGATVEEAEAGDAAADAGGVARVAPLDEDDGAEMLTLCLSLLSVLVGGGIKVTTEEASLVRSLLPILAALGSHPDGEVVELATVLRMSVLSFHRATGEGEASAFDEDNDDVGSYDTVGGGNRASGKRGGGGRSDGSGSGSGSGSADGGADEEVEADDGETEVALALELGMAELRDPLLAVQAGGVRRITALVRRRLPAMAARADDVFALMMTQVRHSESYLFLSAVYGIAALVDAYAERMMPRLIRSFCDATLPLQVRTKLGEALVNASRRCGATLPTFAVALVGAFMKHGVAAKASDIPMPARLARGRRGARGSGAGDASGAAAHSDAGDGGGGGGGGGVQELDDPQDRAAVHAVEVARFRASCLINLGSVCRVLGSLSSAALEPHMRNVVGGCAGVLEFECGRPEAEAVDVIVRRAAAYVLALVVDGAGKDAVVSLAEHMPRVRDVLERARDTDADALVRDHAGAALAMFEGHVRASLTPSADHALRVRVLGGP